MASASLLNVLSLSSSNLFIYSPQYAYGFWSIKMLLYKFIKNTAKLLIMPYIKKEEREELKLLVKAIEDEVKKGKMTPGKMDYLITKMIHAYLRQKGLNFSNISEVIGVLEAVKTEFYRRVVAPYEDEKIKDNGDVKF